MAAATPDQRHGEPTYLTVLRHDPFTTAPTPHPQGIVNRRIGQCYGGFSTAIPLYPAESEYLSLWPVLGLGTIAAMRDRGFGWVHRQKDRCAEEDGSSRFGFGCCARPAALLRGLDIAPAVPAVGVIR